MHRNRTEENETKTKDFIISG